MKPRKLSLGLLALSGFFSAANAALVNIATNTLAAPIRLATAWNGGPLPLGSVVRIGTFPNGVPPAVSFSSLNAQFVPLGENPVDLNDGTNGPGAINTATAAGSGWSFTINSVQNTDARFAAGTRLYIMVLDKPTVEEFRYGNCLVISEPAWTIPTAGTRSMPTAQIDQQSEVFWGTYAGPAELRAGQFIPEPSTGAIALLGALCAVSRRRRSLSGATPQHRLTRFKTK